MQAERLGVELVGDALTRLDQPAADLLADPGHAVHQRAVDPVEVDGVRMRAVVDEVNAEELALAAAQRGSGASAVERPGCDLHAGDDLDLLVVGDELPLAHDAA